MQSNSFSAKKFVLSIYWIIFVSETLVKTEEKEISEEVQETVGMICVLIEVLVL